MTFSEYSLLAVAAFFVTSVLASVLLKGHLARIVLASGLACLLVGSWLALEEGGQVPAPIILAGVLALLGWSTLKALRLEEAEGTRSIGPREEATVAAVLVAAVGLRLIGLEKFPDFIHGEESLWTWVAGTSLFSDERPWPSNWITHQVPVSYYQAWPFFEIFGLDYYAARYSVAFWGSLSTVLFYVPARRLAGPLGAIVATAFFATSMVTLAASRAAYVQGPILFWTVVTLLVYVEAQKRESLLFALMTGVAIVLGLLTYQTFVTVPAALALHTTYIAVREAWTARSLRPRRVFATCLMALPVGIMSPKIAEHFETMRGYSTAHSNSLTAIEPEFWEAPGDYLAQIFENASVLTGELFTRQSVTDFLVTNSDGPVILPGVMLLGLVGLAILLSRAWEPWPSFLLIWLSVTLATSPLILGAPMVRTFLSAFPVIFITAGIGASSLACTAFQSLSGASWHRLRQPLSAAVAISVVAVCVLGARVYFDKTRQTVDGEIRASFVNNVLPLVGKSDHVILPYAQSSGDWFDVERNSVRFVLAGQFHGFENVSDYYAAGSHLEFLAMLQGQGANPSIVVVRDAAGGPPAVAKSEMQKALGACYPAATWTAVPYFLVATVQNPMQSHCQATLKLMPSQTRARNPDALEWSTSAEAGPFALSIERRRDDVRFFEMEAFRGGNGWGGEARYAAGYTGDGYFFDDVIATTIAVEADVPASGSYDLWLRTYRRAADDTHRFLTIEGEDEAEVSPPSAAPLNEWVWERFGPYEVEGDKLRFALRREGRGPALFIDSMYLSRSGAFDPLRESAWLTAIEETMAPGAGNRYVFDLKGKLGPGVYRWRVTALGEGLVDGLGGRLVSETREFTVE
jgi:hypothetical protein